MRGIAWSLHLTSVISLVNPINTLICHGEQKWRILQRKLEVRIGEERSF